MVLTLKKDAREEKELRFVFGSAFILTMFLFFIDEGYYDFRWMMEGFNWIIFFIYFIMLSFSQILILKMTPRIPFSYKKMIGVFLIGSAFALWIAFTFVFSAGLS